MIDLLVVIAIISVIVAILSPTLWRVRRSAQITASLHRLHQLHGAAMQYQADVGPDEPPGEALPPYSYVYGTLLGFSKDYFQSPCGYVEGIEDNNWRMSYQYWVIDDESRLFFAEDGDKAILFNDPHCNDSAEQFNSIYKSKRELAVTYGGNLRNIFKPGDPGDRRWWIEN